MLKRLSLTFLTLVALLLSLSQKAIADNREYMAEEVESFAKQTPRAALFSAEVTTAPTGTLTVKGEPSEFQMFNRVKAVKCNPSTTGDAVVANRKSCTTTSYFDINETKALEEGYYLLGFENTIYPGFVKVVAGQDNVITLQKIAIPGNGTAKVYRNLNSAVEQKKMMFTQFQLGKSFFSLAQYDFGDLYLRKFPLPDLMPNVEYSFCDQRWSDELDPQNIRLCRAYKSGSFSAMKIFFDFNSDSTHSEYVPRVPGDAFEYTFGRLLVSAPTTGANVFVNVLPGDYTIETFISGKTTRTNVSVSGATSFGLEQ